MSSQQQLAMMDNEGRVPPQQAIYSDLLGVSYPSKKTQTEFTCSNGDTFNPAGKNTLEIPIAVGSGQWVDLSNSFLKFTINYTQAANNEGCFKSPHDFISRIQVLGTNSEILEDIQGYNVIARLLYNHQLGDDGLTYNTNLGESAVPAHKATLAAAVGQRVVLSTDPTNIGNSVILANKITGGTLGGVAGDGGEAQPLYNEFQAPQFGTTGDTLAIAFPIISGICSSGKYLPLGMLKNRSLTLRITLETANRCFQNQTGNNAITYTATDCAFVADVITMAETYNQRFMDMVRSVGSVSIHYTTYKNYQDSLAAAAASANILIPDSSRSLKSVFTCFIPATAGNESDDLRLANPAVRNYQYNILSELYPQKQVTIDSTAASLDRNQAFANLHIALGQLGSITSRSAMTSDGYVPRGAVGQTELASGSFAIGVCCEAHNKSSNLLESGINLQNSSQPIRCIINTMTNSAVAKTIHSFTLSDRLLEIDRDGNLRSSG